MRSKEATREFIDSIGLSDLYMLDALLPIVGAVLKSDINAIRLGLRDLPKSLKTGCLLAYEESYLRNYNERSTRSS